MPCTSRLCCKGATSVESAAKQQIVGAPVASSAFFGGSNLGAQAGYTQHEDLACTGRNELGIHKKTSQQSCADMCSANPSCISFEYKAKTDKCQLSTSCAPKYMKKSTTGWDTFTKEAKDAVLSPWQDGPCSNVCGGGEMTQSRTVVAPAEHGGETGPLQQTVPCNEQPCSMADLYDEVAERGCRNRNELGWKFGASPEECANACTGNPECITFEYFLDARCALSTSCTRDLTKSYPGSGVKFFSKRPTTKAENTI